MVLPQQPETVVLQSGQGRSGRGLHVFGRHWFSARSDDTDRSVECDFLPTIAVQGVPHGDRKGLRSDKRVREEELVRFSVYLKFDEEVGCLIAI